MHFLNSRRGEAWNDDLVITESLYGTAVFAGQTDRRYTHRSRLVEGCEYIRALATGAETDEDVSGTTQSFDLARKDAIVAIVVSDAGESRHIGVQTDRREWATIALVTADEFFSQVQGVGSASAVATG